MRQEIISELPESVRSALIIIAIVFVALGGFIILFLLLYKFRQNKLIQEKQLLEANFKQIILQTQLEIQEQTFQNISQEIHDNIGQVLTLAKLNLNTVGEVQPEKANEKILRSKDLVSKAIIDLRDLSKSLNTDLIKEIGLSETLKREVSLISKTDQFETVFKLEGEPFRFDTQKELIIFRIYQELLNNIIKHSKAKTVIVKLKYTPQIFELLVSDDGSGFDIHSLKSEGDFGLGLRNMKKRAMLVGAELSFESSFGKGTNVSIRLSIT